LRVVSPRGGHSRDEIAADLLDSHGEIVAGGGHPANAVNLVADVQEIRFILVAARDDRAAVRVSTRLDIDLHAVIRLRPHLAVVIVVGARRDDGPGLGGDTHWRAPG